MNPDWKAAWETEGAIRSSLLFESLAGTCSVFGARCSVLTGDFVAAASVGALLYFFRVHLCLCLRHVPDLSSSQNKSRCGRGSERDARCMMHDV